MSLGTLTHVMEDAAPSIGARRIASGFLVVVFVVFDCVSLDKSYIFTLRIKKCQSSIDKFTIQLTINAFRNPRRCEESCRIAASVRSRGREFEVDSLRAVQCAAHLLPSCSTSDASVESNLRRCTSFDRELAMIASKGCWALTHIVEDASSAISASRGTRCYETRGFRLNSRRQKLTYVHDL